MRFMALAVGDHFKFVVSPTSTVDQRIMVKVSSVSYRDADGRRFKAGPHASVQPVDIAVENKGSVVMLRPLNLDAWLWLERNANGPFYEGSLPVEPRYSGPIVLAARDAGLSVLLGA